VETKINNDLPQKIKLNLKGNIIKKELHRWIQNQKLRRLKVLVPMTKGQIGSEIWQKFG
jgi:hypothetical protein